MSDERDLEVLRRISAPAPSFRGFVCAPGGGVILTGSAQPAEPPAADLVTVPAFPGANVVPPAVVPEPPLLPPDADGPELFRIVLRVFRTVHEAERRAPWFRHPGTLERYRPGITEAAHALRVAGIRPARWAQWSFGVWREVAKRDVAPPVDWVFRASRVDEHAGWFEAAWGSYRSGRVVLGDKHRELLVRHARMMTSIRHGTRVDAAVAQFFPNGLYDLLVAAARVEADDIARDLRQRVAAGELID